MRLLVDGMNVIGSRPDGWWRDRPGAWRRLAAQLEAYARASGERVSLFLDGRRPADWQEREGVETTFAGGRRGAADDAIAARVEAEAEPESLAVVTSDRGLAARVRPRGAEVIPAARFRRRLEELAGE